MEKLMNWNLDVLDEAEAVNIGGGGFFEKLGAGMHEFVCGVKEVFDDYCEKYERAYKDGYRGPM